MGIDQNERRRQHAADKPKYSTKHPIAAIEKRIIDSPTFADLSFSARAVLMLMARNIEKGRNGHIQLSERQADENGIERKTLRRALADLIAHQLIVMTWRGGKITGQCNRYALTWLPLKDRKGIHADHFKLDAWRDWTPGNMKKEGGRKCPLTSTQNVPLTRISSPKMSPTQGDKKGPIEVIAIPRSKEWMPAYLGSLAMHGQAGRQCFQIPPPAIARTH